LPGCDDGSKPLKSCAGRRIRGYSYTRTGQKVSDGYFDTQGRLIASSTITVNMWRFDKLRQFQFISKTVQKPTFYGAR